MGQRFNPAPGWPPPPPGFVPPPHWQPDPSWPPAPPGWQLWVDDSAPGQGSIPARPGEFGAGAGGAPPWGDDLPTGDAPWADLSEPPSGPLTGPPTQAYVPGATGPQDPFGPGDPFDHGDRFTRQSPPDPWGAPDGQDRHGHRARTGKADGYAIASLLLGVFGITIIGAILSINFGIMALRRVRRTGQPGRGLAIAGLVLSAIWLLIGTFFLLGAGKGPAQPSASGVPSGGHSSASGGHSSSSGGHSSSPTAKPGTSASPGSASTNVFALHPGQCFQNPPASQTELGVTYVPVVACTKPHNAQAFVQFTVQGARWPGTEAIQRQADSGCHDRIKGNVDTSKIKSSMSLRYLYPLQPSWTSGHRTITCLIVDSTSDLKTSLLKAHPTGH